MVAEITSGISCSSFQRTVGLLNVVSNRVWQIRLAGQSELAFDAMVPSIPGGYVNFRTLAMGRHKAYYFNYRVGLLGGCIPCSWRRVSLWPDRPQSPLRSVCATARAGPPRLGPPGPLVHGSQHTTPHIRSACARTVNRQSHGRNRFLVLHRLIGSYRSRPDPTSRSTK